MRPQARANEYLRRKPYRRDSRRASMQSARCRRAGWCTDCRRRAEEAMDKRRRRQRTRSSRVPRHRQPLAPFPAWAVDNAPTMSAWIISAAAQTTRSRRLVKGAGIALWTLQIGNRRPCGAQTARRERPVATRPTVEPMPNARGEAALCTRRSAPRAASGGDTQRTGNSWMSARLIDYICLADRHLVMLARLSRRSVAPAARPLARAPRARGASAAR